MSRTRWSGAILSLLVLTSFFGCGPITSTTAIAEATVAIHGAKEANAAKFAAYEYASAVEYLRKATEEEGYAQYQAAIDLARKARDLAEKAAELSMGSPATQQDSAPDRLEKHDPIRGVSGESL